MALLKITGSRPQRKQVLWLKAIPLVYWLQLPVCELLLIKAAKKSVIVKQSVSPKMNKIPRNALIVEVHATRLAFRGEELTLVSYQTFSCTDTQTSFVSKPDNGWWVEYWPEPDLPLTWPRPDIRPIFNIFQTLLDRLDDDLDNWRRIFSVLQQLCVFSCDWHNITNKYSSYFIVDIIITHSVAV